MTQSVQLKVAEQISNLGPAVEEKVVGALVDREKNRRADALVQTMDKLSKMELELKKLGPDQVALDDKGEKVSETYSKARAEERKKLSEKIDKHAKAITKALEKSDLGDVYNLAKDQNASS
jgi:hypothetical protein